MTQAEMAFSTAYTLMQQGIQCKLSRDIEGMWAVIIIGDEK